MKQENDFQALQRRIAELETENAALRAELQKLQIKPYGECLPSKSFCPQASRPEQLTLYASNESERPTLEEVSAPMAQHLSFSNINQTSSPVDKIHLFRSLFRGRDDVYALRWHSEKTQKSGYSPVCGNEWAYGLCKKGQIPCSKCPNRSLLALTDDVLYRHFAGKDPFARDVVGLYPMLADETCFLLALDFDDANWQECARAVADLCRKQEIPFALERSRSGQGAHLWIFFSDPVPCARARALGDALLTAAMARCDGLRLTAYDRMFPNQDTLPAGGFGNLIALPLQGQARRKGNSVFLDEQFLPYPDPWAFLAGVKQLSPAQVESIISSLCPSGATLGVLATQEQEPSQEVTSAPKATPWKRTLVRSLTPSDFSALPLQIIRADGLYIDKQALTPSARNRLIRLAAFQNPEFYKNRHCISPRIKSLA